MKYIFRGVVVFDYDPLTKEVTNPPTEHNLNSFNYCSFIVEDFALISDFFRKAHLHATGQIGNEDLEDIEVY